MANKATETLKKAGRKIADAVPKDHLKHRLVLIAVFAALTLVYVLAFMPRTAFRPAGAELPAGSTAEITALSPLTQRVALDGGTVKSLRIGFDPMERRNHSEYTVELLDGAGGVLSGVKFNADKVPLEGGYDVPLEPQARVAAGEYTIRISSGDAEPGDALGVKYGAGGGLAVGAQTYPGSMVVEVGYASFSQNIWIITAALIAAVSLAILFWGKKLHVNVLVLALVFGVMFSLVTPILDTPDEAEHAAKAFLMADGQFVTPISGGGADLTVSYNDVFQNMEKTIAENGLGGKPVSDEMQHNSNWAAGQNFINYLPQTLGLWVGKLFGAGLAGYFYLGRIFNALVFAVFAFFAVKLAPKFKLYMAVLSLAPMTLILAGSYNPETLVTGCSLLLGGYFMKMWFDDKTKITWKQLLAFFVILALIVMRKYTLIAFALLPFFIPAARYKDKKTKWIGSFAVLAGAAAAAVGMVLFSVWMNADPAGGNSALDGVSEGGASVAGQIAHIMANPSSAFSAVSKTVMRDFADQLAQWFHLGQLQEGYTVYGIFALAYFAFLALVAFAYTRYEYKPELAQKGIPVKLGARVWIFLTILATIALTYLALYLTWTPVGADAVGGVQGRYLIPMFFLLPFLGQAASPLVSEDAYRRGRLNIQFMAVLFAGVTLLTTAFRYY